MYHRIFKEPVEGQVWLGKTNLSGDGQANLKYHGGPDKAVLAYSAAHYPAWHNEITHIKLPYGAFAENLTILGLLKRLFVSGTNTALATQLFMFHNHDSRAGRYRTGGRLRI